MRTNSKYISFWALKEAEKETGIDKYALRTFQYLGNVIQNGYHFDIYGWQQTDDRNAVLAILKSEYPDAVIAYGKAYRYGGYVVTASIGLATRKVRKSNPKIRNVSK